MDKLKKNRERAISYIDNSDFHKFLVDDIIDRLCPIDKNFSNILLLNSPISNKVAARLSDDFKVSQINFSSEEEVCEINNQYDLIIFPFGLHWVNDPQKILFFIKTRLRDKGVFFCNFPGAGTLKNLRNTLIKLEEKNSNIYNPHISPFIKFDQVTQLLQQAGFMENIIDMESIEFEYKTPWHLMKAIKNSGESNILKSSGGYSINKTIYFELKKEKDLAFIDQINLITFISSLKKNSIKLKTNYYNS